MSGAGDFVHLHVASAYSLRYGMASPAALAARAREHGMPVLALTDCGGVYGAVKHAVACGLEKIAPVLGADLALRSDTAGPGVGSRHLPRLRNETADRVTVLAVGRRGWASLCRLVSAAHNGGERGAPAVTPELVAAHAEGLIALVGPSSDVGRAIAARRSGHAAALLARWRERCETVIEIVDHHAPGDTYRAARMLQLAREAGVPAVLTNAVRYRDPADGPVAQVLDAARQLVPLAPRHLGSHNGQAYLASGAEMARIAARICGAANVATTRELLAATTALGWRCALDPARDLGIGRRHLPEITDGDPLALLRARCEEGLYRRGHRIVGRATADRLDHELAIITNTGLASYFLTVADVAALIRERGIRCAIRGSGAGSLVNHLIGISGIDPLEHDLIMERFLSERRAGLPDIDLDVESARRIEAYRAILDRYGEERCACVSMMETYRARSAIRDVASALGLPSHEIDAVARAFPHIRARHIRDALTDLPELRASNLGISQLAGLLRAAERLDGLPRHIAMHPCGVVLSDQGLLDRMPVERSLDGLPLGQFDKDDVETAGMIKLDVLGVRMQSTLAYALGEIERTRGERVDIDAIDPEDEPTFEMIRAARTLGCFQIESPGQRELVTKLGPRDIGDLIVDISLFRPGPVNSDMVTPLLDIRHGRRPPCFPHEDLVDPLRETGGVVIFHEQVLRIIDAMTACGLADAERLRRQLIDDASRAAAADWFSGEAGRRGYDTGTVAAVWEVLDAFGAFGFCKAHAAAFAVPTYQSAWLKRHYPAAFYAGVLTHDPGMYPKRMIASDARLSGIPILPADVNASAPDWQVEPLRRQSAAAYPREGVRVGLREVRGISAGEVGRIYGGRPYASLRDFWERARVSRPVTERLVLVGAFDSLYAGSRTTRRDLLARVGVLDRRSPDPRSRTELAPGPGGVAEQLALDLDGAGDGFADLVPAGQLRELTLAERVEAELEILGIDISQHVLGFYRELLGGLGVVRSRDLHRCRAGARVLVAGVKIATQTPAVRSGQRIIFATLDDGCGPVDLAFFESVQDRCAARVFGSWLLLVRGKVRKAGGVGGLSLQAGAAGGVGGLSPQAGAAGGLGSSGSGAMGAQAVSVNAVECWDLPALEEIRSSRGIGAVRAAMAAGDVPGGPGTARKPSARPGAVNQARTIVYSNGFTLSPYAETGSPGSPVKRPPRKLWHASPGSSGT